MSTCIVAGRRLMTTSASCMSEDMVSFCVMSITRERTFECWRLEVSEESSGGELDAMRRSMSARFAISSTAGRATIPLPRMRTRFFLRILALAGVLDFSVEGANTPTSVSVSELSL